MPYEVLEKKTKKVAKGTRSGLRRKDTADLSSEDETDPPVAEDDDEEEENNSPLRGKEEKVGLHEPKGEGTQEGEGLPRGELHMGCR